MLLRTGYAHPHDTTEEAATAVAPLPPPPRAAASSSSSPVALKGILAIVGNADAASARLRVSALIEPLRLRGFDLDLQACPKSWRPRRALLRSAGAYHAVLLHRKLLDPWNWEVLRRHARRVVFDVDDAVMFHPQRVGPYSRLRTALRFAATADGAGHVVAGNEYLAEQFRARGCRKVSVLPTVIDADRYPRKRHAPAAAPRLVWIGSRSTLPYLRAAVPWLCRVAERVRGLRLLVIADQTVFAPAALPVEHVQWSLESEAAALCRGDIGIAPTPADPWTLGKCGFKVMQYMAAGLPVVASPVGANTALVRPGETGLLPGRLDEWPAAIAALAGDVDLRSRMGAAGRRVVEVDYALDRAADLWAEVLEA